MNETILLIISRFIIQLYIFYLMWRKDIPRDLEIIDVRQNKIQIIQ